MNNNMNYNQNNNYGKSLFNNESANDTFNNDNSYKNDLNYLETKDMPPELGQIKNLSDAPISEAPTLDALGPANFIGSNQTITKDPLDLYENKVIVNDNNSFDFRVPSTNISNLGDYDNNSLSQSNNEMFNSNINNDIVNDFNSSMYNSYVNNQNENKVNISNDFKYNNYENKFNNLMSTDEKNSKEDGLKNYDVLDKSLNNDSSYNFDVNKYIKSLEQKDDKYPKVLSEENYLNDEVKALAEEEEKISSDAIKDKVPDMEISKKVSTVNENFATSDLDVEDLPEDKVEDIPNIDSLGIDSAYTEPDSLEIMDEETENQLKNESEEIISIDNNINSVEKIKKLVAELKASGENIKVEEFDFESMHQLIIIVEK